MRFTNETDNTKIDYLPFLTNKVNETTCILH